MNSLKQTDTLHEAINNQAHPFWTLQGVPIIVHVCLPDCYDQCYACAVPAAENDNRECGLTSIMHLPLMGMQKHWDTISHAIFNAGLTYLSGPFQGVWTETPNQKLEDRFSTGPCLESAKEKKELRVRNSILRSARKRISWSSVFSGYLNRGISLAHGCSDVCTLVIKINLHRRHLDILLQLMYLQVGFSCR